jgi:site-specific recombinase XerD
LKAILEGAGLPSDRPVHKLRHSCASVLISQKVDALVVKEVLGHSQVSLTLSVYAHLFPGADRGAASAMDAAFGGQRL